MGLQSPHKHGVNAIKEAMRAAQDVSSEKLQVKIVLDSSPKYVLSVKTTDIKAGNDILDRAIKACKTTIESYDGGSFDYPHNNDDEKFIVSDEDSSESCVSLNG